jgi:hypothetical protein
VIARVREFIAERFAQPRQTVSLRQADQYGYTWEEYERLKLRGGPQFVAARAALKMGGRLSKGIALGWQSGFDSGRSLDYVYENQPQGSSRLGKFVDANYLNSIGLARDSAAQGQSRKVSPRCDRKAGRGWATDPHSRCGSGGGSIRPGNDAGAPGDRDAGDVARQ